MPLKPASIRCPAYVDGLWKVWIGCGPGVGQVWVASKSDVRCRFSTHVGTADMWFPTCNAPTQSSALARLRGLPPCLPSPPTGR
eukprot:16610-Chlamydomonas_euryale.AAC.26